MLLNHLKLDVETKTANFKSQKSKAGVGNGLERVGKGWKLLERVGKGWEGLEKVE